ncbi:MAG: hypothetical protein KQA38_03830 [Candidatus Aenigmarchaeota archaeon]|nr:hypothetical protein [Candidatus Aenigmarchaeota archaeon]
MSEENKLPGNNTSDTDMHTSAIVTGREIDLDRERAGKGEIASNDNSSSIETGSLDTNTHMHTSLSKLKNISLSDGRIHLWLGKDLKKAVIKAGIDVSEFLRAKLLEELRNRNIQIEIEDPELIVRVRCIHCGFIQNTSTIKLVRCVNCNRFFRVFTKKGSRIRGIIKGNEYLLQRFYYRVYGMRGSY